MDKGYARGMIPSPYGFPPNLWTYTAAVTDDSGEVIGSVPE